MAKFTCTLHGDQANALVLYWNKQHKREAKARQWFMAAMALGCLLEAWLYAYFIIWSGDDGNDPAKDEQIPDGLYSRQINTDTFSESSRLMEYGT